MKKTGTFSIGWPWAVALKLICAICTPSTLLQSTVASTRSSRFEGETEPLFGVNISHEALDVAVNVKGDGPAAPTSMNRELRGTYESSVKV